MYLEDCVLAISTTNYLIMHGASSSFSSSFCHTICVTGGVCCLCYCLQFTSSSLAASWSSAAWCLTYWEFIRRHQYEPLLPGWFWIRRRWMAIVTLYKNRSFLLPVLRTCVSDPVAENWLYYAQQFLRDNVITWQHSRYWFHKHALPDWIRYIVPATVSEQKF